MDLKRRLGLGETIITPSGHEIFKPASTAFGRMSEPDFAQHLDAVVNLLSRWLGVDRDDFISAVEQR